MIPQCQKHTIFSVPLFFKSDSQGIFNVKLRFEYVPLSVLSTPVSKEFDIKISVVRPFALNFGFSSSVEAPCGVVLTPSSATNNQTQWRSVLRGDTINLSSSLSCLNSLNGEVEILALGVVMPSAAKQLQADPHKPTAESMFRLVNPSPHLSSAAKSTRYANLLCDRSAVADEAPLVMSAGEKYVGTVDVECLDAVDSYLDSSLILNNPSLLLPTETNNSGPENTPSNLSSPTSIGNISIKWRTSQRHQMSPIDLAPYLARIPEEKRSRYRIGAPWVTKDAASFSWLLPVGASVGLIERESSELSQCLVSDISRSLICSMTFVVPAIQVIFFFFEWYVLMLMSSGYGRPV